MAYKLQSEKQGLFKVGSNYLVHALLYYQLRCLASVQSEFVVSMNNCQLGLGVPWSLSEVTLLIVMHLVETFLVVPLEVLVVSLQVLVFLVEGFSYFLKEAFGLVCIAGHSFQMTKQFLVVEAVAAFVLAIESPLTVSQPFQKIYHLVMVWFTFAAQSCL